MIRCAGAVAGALLVIGGALPAAAQTNAATTSTGVFATSQKIYDMCSSKVEVQVNECTWYVIAAYDMMKLYGDTGKGGEKICVPGGTTPTQLRDVVMDYWRGKPETLVYSAPSTIYNALVQRFNCGEAPAK